MNSFCTFKEAHAIRVLITLLILSALHICVERISKLKLGFLIAALTEFHPTQSYYADRLGVERGRGAPSKESLEAEPQEQKLNETENETRRLRVDSE